MQSSWQTSRVLALVITFVACSDLALAQSGRRPRRPTRTPPPTTETTEVAPEEPPAPAESAYALGVPVNETPEVAPATDDVPATDADETTDDGRPPRVKFHAAGLNFHATMFATEDQFGYSLLGPSVSYTYFIGRRWGFALRGSMYFPLSGRYAGGVVDERRGLSDPYDVRRIGLDQLIMAATRHEFGSNLAMIVGFGLHVQSYKLVGKNYIAMDGITGGIGGMTRLDYRISPLVSIGLDVAVGLDPLDLIRHSNRSVFSASVSSGFSLGLTFD